MLAQKNSEEASEIQESTIRCWEECRRPDLLKLSRLRLDIFSHSVSTTLHTAHLMFPGTGTALGPQRAHRTLAVMSSQ